MILHADSKRPVAMLVDVRKGGQIYRLHDRSALVKWSNDYTITSLGTGDGYDLIVVTTSGETQYALVNTADTTNRRVAPWQTAPAFNTTPTHIAADKTGCPQTFTWTAAWEPDQSAWIAVGGTGRPVCLLVHGGPIADDSIGGMDNLASCLAASGAKGIALRYPTLNVTFEQAMAPLRAAVTKYKPDMIVCHSLGGYFGGILAYQTGLPLVMVATDDQPSDPYRSVTLKGPLARDEMAKATNHVVVITGSADAVATVAEHQSLVADLAASGHPGKWLIIDGADHNSILSDVTTIATIIGG